MFAAVLTTATSITAAILDEFLESKTAFLPRNLNALFEKNLDPRVIRRCQLWRSVLDRLVLSLADQQLVTGFVLMITGWMVYSDTIHGAHFAMVVYLSCLSSSSHLAARVILRKYFGDNPTLALFRLLMISAFAILLCASILRSGAFGPFTWILESLLFLVHAIGFKWITSVVPILWVFWTGTWQIVPETRENLKVLMYTRLWPYIRGPLLPFWAWVQIHKSERESRRLYKHFWAVLNYIFFLSPLTVFMLQLVFAALSASMALAQKFSPRRDTDDCTLNSKEENEMGYGQILAFLMLALPVIAAFEAYKG